MEILFVCYANLCRSAIAERIARRAIADLPGLGPLRLSASSAGTHAQPGRAMHPVAHAVLIEAGIDTSGFASRALTADLLDGAGLVLAAARQQRAACVTRVPAALPRTFTLRQFGRIAAAVDPHRLRGVAPPRRLRALADEVLLLRSEVPPVPGDEDDLADPVGGTIDDMRACAARIRDSLWPVFELLSGADHRPAPTVGSVADDTPFPMGTEDVGRIRFGSRPPSRYR